MHVLRKLDGGDENFVAEQEVKEVKMDTPTYSKQ